MKRLAQALLASIGLFGLSVSGQQFRVGGVEVTAPKDWRETEKSDERITLSSPDENQQATISIMRLDVAPSFADFKRICAHRLEAEKEDIPDVKIVADDPFEDAGAFGMFFSGYEKEAARRFSGYLWLKKSELITLYIESVGTDQTKHTQIFQTFVQGLKRK